MLKVLDFLENKYGNKRWLIFLEQLILRFEDDNVTELGAQLTYYLTLSIFPFIIFFLNLLQYTPLSDTEVLNSLLSPLPQATQSVLSDIINGILQNSNAALLSIGANESDGNFPNHQPDPCVPKNQEELARKVLELGYDIGIGIDGDADRVGIVDNTGQILGADLYMLIMYRYLNPNLKVRKALFDVKCSKSLIDGIKELRLELVMYRTGNSYSNMKMQEGNFDFGGEYSGHVFFRDKFPGFDDGIYAGLRMIEVVHNSKRSVHDWLDGMNSYFSTEELKFKTTDHKKFKIINKIKEYAAKQNYTYADIDGIRVEFEDGWALVRASNTGPNITARFEAKTQDRLEQIQKEFTEVLEKNL